MIKACIDTNIWISGLLFKGTPSIIVRAAFNRKFEPILSQVILNELETNLLLKFDYNKKDMKKLINRLLEISELYEPTGNLVNITPKMTDNLVIETAILGNAKYLVTGDKKHLLHLKSHKMVKIIDASEFASILKLN